MEQSNLQAPLFIPASPGAPIACDMTDASDTPEERFAEYARLFPHALVARDRALDAVELTFANKPGVAEWVADLARREAACCPFFTHQVTFGAEHVVWRWSSEAGNEAQIFLDELYELPGRCAAGLDGLLERLTQRGMSIARPDAKRIQFGGAGRPGLWSKLKSACGC